MGRDSSHKWRVAARDVERKHEYYVTGATIKECYNKLRELVQTQYLDERANIVSIIGSIDGEQL